MANDIIEPFFIDHLHSFLFDLDAWVAARSRDRAADRSRIDEAIERDLADLRRLDRLADQVRADYLRRLEGGEQDAADIAAAGMRDVEDQRIHLDMTERIPALDTVDRRSAEEFPARPLHEA